MEVIAIKYFLCVARCRNFSQAADENNISQSSFSKAIMRLERDLGVKLIDRGRHPISLTPAGKLFYDRMNAIEPLFQQTMDELHAFTGGDVIRLLICPKSYQYKIALDEYTRLGQRVQMQIDETSDISCITQNLQSGKYDFVISPRPFDLTDDIRATRLYDDELYLLTANTSSFAARESVSLSELSGQDLYESPYSKLLIYELSRRFDFLPRIVYPLEGKGIRREEAIHWITLNKGIGIYPGRDLAAYRTDNMRCVPIREVPSLPIMLLERSIDKDTPAKQRFRSWISENMERFITARLDVEKFNQSI